jgi:hypothetical protein
MQRHLVWKTERKRAARPRIGRKEKYTSRAWAAAQHCLKAEAGWRKYTGPSMHARAPFPPDKPAHVGTPPLLSCFSLCCWITPTDPSEVATEEKDSQFGSLVRLLFCPSHASPDLVRQVATSLTARDISPSSDQFIARQALIRLPNMPNYSVRPNHGLNSQIPNSRSNSGVAPPTSSAPCSLAAAQRPVIRFLS